MKTFALCLLMITMLGVSGCAEMNNASTIKNETVNISSGGEVYPAYLAVPTMSERLPAVVLIHSYKGLEPGYKTMVDKFSSEGFVVIAPEWQTFNSTPRDEVVTQLVLDSVAYLKTMPEADTNNLGLAGFCAGGRYTMLILPQMHEFKAGVAWYGFPYWGGFANQSHPVEFISQLQQPLLIIHGTYDQPSPISDIYRYVTALNDSGKYFEMKVYQGEPHGFMIEEDGQLSQSFVAKDAYWQMVSFFNRTLRQAS